MRKKQTPHISENFIQSQYYQILHFQNQFLQPEQVQNAPHPSVPRFSHQSTAGRFFIQRFIGRLLRRGGRNAVQIAISQKPDSNEQQNRYEFSHSPTTQWKPQFTKNFPGTPGAQFFATTLNNYNCLEYLDFRLNFILDSGATELFKAAASYSSLRTLILASSRITSASVPSLCELITTNEGIREIDLTCNSLDSVSEVNIHWRNRFRTQIHEQNIQYPVGFQLKLLELVSFSN